MAPQGDGGGGPRQPPPPKRRAGLCRGRAVGQFGSSRQRCPLPWAVPPPWVPPSPLEGPGWARGCTQRRGHGPDTLHTHCISSGKQNKAKQNPQTQANKNQNPPQPQNIKYKQKTAFSFNKQQTKLQFSVGRPCQPGRSAAGRTGGFSFSPLPALRKVPRGGLRAPSPVLPRPSQLPRSTRPLWDPETLRVPLHGRRAWKTAGKRGNSAGGGWARGPGGDSPLPHARSTHSLRGNRAGEGWHGLG